MKRSVPWPLVMGVLAAGLYLSLPAARFNFDGVACAIAVELGEPRNLVHGNHVAYGALGWLLHGLLRCVGYGGPAIVSLQALSSLLGAAGVAGFCALLLNLGFEPLLAAAAAAALAVSRLYWAWSLEAQVYPLGAALLVWGAAELARKQPRPWLVGLLQAGAVLGHVGHVMFLPAALALLGDRKARGRYAVALAAAVATGYAAAIALFVRPATLFALRTWLLGSAALSVDRQFKWMGEWSLQGLLVWARIGLELPTGSAATGAAIWLAAAWGAVAAWRGGAPPCRRAVVLALAWLAGYALLYSNWQPFTVVYRYSDVPALWLLVACAVEAACPSTEAQGGPLRSLAKAAGLLAFAIFLGVWNLGAAILPGSRPELNADLQRALWLSRETPRDALIVVHATEQVYVPYFADRMPLNIRYCPDGAALKAKVLEARREGTPVYAVPQVLPGWAAEALAGLGWRQVSSHGSDGLYLIH